MNTQQTSMTKVVAAVAVVAVSVGVTIGVVASSSPATSLYAPAAVSVASRPAVAYAPVSNMRMAATNNNQYTAEPAQYYETESVEEPQYYTQAPESNTQTWMAAALFAASAAAGASTTPAANNRFNHREGVGAAAAAGRKNGSLDTFWK